MAESYVQGLSCNWCHNGDNKQVIETIYQWGFNGNNEAVTDIYLKVECKHCHNEYIVSGKTVC